MGKAEQFQQLIDEAIRLELNIGELYLLFHELFPEDARFWWELAIEEENHAALLKTVKQMASVNIPIPEELLPGTIEELMNSNNLVAKMKESFQENPDRIKALRFAYQVEKSAGELHYNSFMTHASDSRITRMFKKLNGSDLDHAERIKNYMEHKSISL